MLLIVLTLASGLAMPLGAWIAYRNWGKKSLLRTELRHGIVAFGGGALLSAIALVLIPEGTKHLSIAMLMLCFLGGGLVFMLLDIFMAKSGNPMSQLAAMLSDFLPEALALGATLSVHPKTAFLLAIIMALQNVPEGFNAFEEMMHSHKYNPKKLIAIFCGLALLGPAVGLIGYYLFADSIELISGIMVFAAGGILYIIFEDIAPQVPMKNHWIPPLGALAGFLLGVTGHMLLHPGG